MKLSAVPRAAITCVAVTVACAVINALRIADDCDANDSLLWEAVSVGGLAIGLLGFVLAARGSAGAGLVALLAWTFAWGANLATWGAHCSA